MTALYALKPLSSSSWSSSSSLLSCARGVTNGERVRILDEVMRLQAEQSSKTRSLTPFLSRWLALARSLALTLALALYRCSLVYFFKGGGGGGGRGGEEEYQGGCVMINTPSDEVECCVRKYHPNQR